MVWVYLRLGAQLTEAFGKCRIDGYIMKTHGLYGFLLYAADALHSVGWKPCAVRKDAGFGNTKILELHTKSFHRIALLRNRFFMCPFNTNKNPLQYKSKRFYRIGRIVPDGKYVVKSYKNAIIDAILTVFATKSRPRGGTSGAGDWKV